MGKAGLIMSGLAQGLGGIANAQNILNGNPNSSTGQPGGSGNGFLGLLKNKNGVGPTLPAPQEWANPDSSITSLGLGSPNRGMLSRGLFNERKGL